MAILNGGFPSSGGAAEEVYSTEETRIGTWIDGKPLYRVAMDAVLPTDNSWHNISSGVRNVETVTSLYGVCHHPTRTQTFYPLPMALPGGNGVILFAYYRDGYSDVYGIQGLNGYCTYPEFKGASVKMIMEYTKTTDPAPTSTLSTAPAATRIPANLPTTAVTAAESGI